MSMRRNLGRGLRVANQVNRATGRRHRRGYRRQGSWVSVIVIVGIFLFLHFFSDDDSSSSTNQAQQDTTVTAPAQPVGQPQNP